MSGVITQIGQTTWAESLHDHSFDCVLEFAFYLQKILKTLSHCGLVTGTFDWPAEVQWPSAKVLDKFGY
jgi:hypothetical protein